MTREDEIPTFERGSSYLFIPARDQSGPTWQSDRYSTYEFEGERQTRDIKSGVKVCAFHKTRIESLFEATTLEAYDSQNNGQRTIRVGNGILKDWELRGGTGTHDHHSGVNFYLHF